MKKQVIGILLIFTVIVACKKNEPVLPNNGIYRGTFHEVHGGEDTTALGLVHLALFEDGQKFNVVGDSSSLSPATHSGTYQLLSGGKINFIYTGEYSSVFHQEHYLDTIYSYTFDDKFFNFSLKVGTILYDYQLIRI